MVKAEFTIERESLKHIVRFVPIKDGWFNVSIHKANGLFLWLRQKRYEPSFGSALTLLKQYLRGD